VAPVSATFVTAYLLPSCLGQCPELKRFVGRACKAPREPSVGELQVDGAQNGGARRRFRHCGGHGQTLVGASSGPSRHESSLVAGPTGDWLAFATDRDIEGIFGNGRSVVHAFRVERKEGEPSSAVHIYVVTKGTRTPAH